MKCIDATRLASESQDRELSLAERASLQMHLVICSGCRRFNAQLGVLRQALRRVDHLSEDGLASRDGDDGHEDAPPPRG
ncbi:MAG TPA: zf-HC2 domain-containing protein [Candidatus Aquabacterium excrementipullorum]|nr:zf-HC2 domain-containing protein [Candidatus Aquabacterium excrementipullorum]